MKTSINHAVLVVLLGLLSAVSEAAAEVIVVNFGHFPSAEVASRSEAQIDWSDGDSADGVACTQCFAAVELQRYLRKMTGRAQDFAIVADTAAADGDLILVGGPASNAASRRLVEALKVDQAGLAALGPEGYRIKSGTAAGRHVLLVAGGGRVGTLYAAYDLLYRLGCRWFAPGELHKEVPTIERIGEFDVTERPAFATRGFLAWENRGNAEFLQWMARNRLDCWCVEDEHRPLMYKFGIHMVGGLHDEEHVFFHPAAPYPYAHPLWPTGKDLPKDPYPVSPEYQGDADKDGKLSYFEAHPEWYALVSRKRIPGIQDARQHGANYCTSNPNATTEFVKNYVQALIDGRYRDADMVRFWTLEHARWCECAACQAQGTPTDRYLLLIHRLAGEIKKARAAGKIRRPVEIQFLAYDETLDPPTRPLPADFDYETCAVTFFPIERCYVHNFDDPQCRLRDTDAPNPRATNAHYVRDLDRWATDPNRLYRGQVAVGEYYNLSRYASLPLCFMHTMANDIPYFHRAGVRHFEYMHVTTGNWGNKALTNYQMARQLWNVRTDCAALWDDYFARRYGPAAGVMRRFYETLEQMFSNISELKCGTATRLARRLEAGEERLFVNAHLQFERRPGVVCDGPTLTEIVGFSADCRKLIDEAGKIDLPPRVQSRIAEDERMFTYGERTIAYLYECVQAFELARADRRDDARRHYAEAARLAELLRADTTSATLSSSHANAPDALAASGAAGALKRLEKLLGPSATASGTAPQ